MQIKLTQLLKELGINIPGRASLTQLKRWKAEIQASDDKMTKIKLALKCAEGVMWIWREKYPTDNRPQAALDAIKEYIKDPSEENKQNCRDAARDAWDAADDAYYAAVTAAANAWDAWDAAAAVATAADNTYYTTDNTANNAANNAIQAITNYQKEHQLNELGINTPGRATLEQLKRWKAEIKASDDIMTKIKLALKCAEGVMWIWREKHPTNNYPQAAINAVKVYINNPSDENAQKCRKAADAAWDNAWTDTNRAVTAAVYTAYAATNAAYAAAANDDYVAATYYAADNAANNAANNAIKALTKYQEERQLNELGINAPGRASLEQLERWEAEIQVSNDEMTRIKLALKCAEGVIWIWREKYPTDNRPQAALNAVKAYIKDPSDENKQNCKKAADAAYDAATAVYAAAAATYAAAAAWDAAYDAAYAINDAYVAAWAAKYAIQALTKYQKEKQLNELK